MTPIDTEKFSRALRARSVDVPGKRFLVSRLAGSDQEQDLKEPVNCGGLGRIRHFQRWGRAEWPQNPLPLDPASRALGANPTDELRAQVFQYAACNWRCWYCFVPFRLLAGREDSSEWVTARELVGLYLREASRPAVIDLSGGQPDLVPEWVPWMMEELEVRGLEDTTYLWSDDNLSNDYFWTYLSDHQIETVGSYANYGRVCCFKGYDPASFAFNTLAEPELFERQFELLGRFVKAGIDVYAYVTFTTPTIKHLRGHMATFVDRLQAVSEMLPLRTVPLRVEYYSPLKTENRVGPDQSRALDNQQRVVDAWSAELEERFSSRLRASNITDVALACSA